VWLSPIDTSDRFQMLARRAVAIGTLIVSVVTLPPLATGSYFSNSNIR